MEKRLIEQYQQIFRAKENTPTWAVHKVAPGHTQELIHCTIPFVGKFYEKEETKILLYASAENLTGYDGYLDCDEEAINRHRSSFDWSIANSNTFFPNVHIQPITDGCLAIVALYVYMKFQEVDTIAPADFLERISFANYCKYTIQPTSSKPNQDYASWSSYLAESHDYIANDIITLKPDYIIMPKTIYWTDREFIDKVKGTARIIPIYQINARNINLRIKNYPKMQKTDLEVVLADWCEHLNQNGIKGKTKENFYSIFRYIDDVMQNQMR